MKYKTIQNVSFRNKRVLLRLDLDVPLKNNRVVDDSRLKNSLPTLKYLSQQQATIIIIGYLGRPNGKRVSSLSLKPVCEALAKMMKQTIVFVSDCKGKQVRVQVHKAQPQSILMLENLRFHPQEEENDLSFAIELSSLADVFVNDSFATMHRSYAGIIGVTKYIPSYMGLSADKEIQELTKIHNPKRPLVVILGGAKVSDKIETLRSLCKKADFLLVCGAMMFAFLKAQKYDVGISMLDTQGVPLAKKLLHKKNILLPLDVVVAKNRTSKSKIVPVTKIPINMAGFDIGPATIQKYIRVIKRARTVFWNGPAGLAEIRAFSEGTNALATAIAKLHATTIICGGDTHAAIRKLRMQSKYTHISLGGGASLEFLSGKKLPGIRALEKKS